ncbi:MAG: hypothetical protein M3Q70_00265 [bacterium]|nr:hypothetical protein [bacterium]
MSQTNPSRTSRKHVLIDKANQVALIALSAAVAIFIFSIFASWALIKQNSYNQRVISQKKKALSQIKTNKANIDQLIKSYESFATEPVNVIGGNPTGSGPKDGDNPRIILDALPSQNDFPGLASSLEKLIQTQGGLSISNLGGSDTGTAVTPGIDAVALAPASGPQTVIIPLGINSTYAQLQTFVRSLEASIRPIYVDRLSIGGSDANMSLNLDLTTYYQPEKTFTVRSEVVK